MPATLGYVIATLSELPGVRTSQLEPHPTPSPRGRSATQTPSNTASRDSRPLGRAGEGLRVAGEGLPTTTLFVPANSRAFFTAVGGLFAFVAFQPAYGQARRSGAVNIREHALEISPATHRRIGRSPEKPQIFLYLFVVVYSRIKENTLQVTPTAKRNSYRVAILVGRLPRVACFARNPGLGNRNSYRVAWGAHRPQWDNHTWL